MALGLAVAENAPDLKPDWRTVQTVLMRLPQNRPTMRAADLRYWRAMPAFGHREDVSGSAISTSLAQTADAYVRRYCWGLTSVT